ncbi:LOW QUALITY PROTEIN: flotillin-1-like [Falco peregrinus]|uniref:LOW QUALITY PROTEIN: flotillin-1-like n=1 Tax=Falco peregrinus TaxID=8954 RepID=UPI00247B1A58|nr:LOW QUALITY PROTEIN: flotillin-1-like [Falco peregrinus]
MCYAKLTRQQIQRISLNTLTLNVCSEVVYTCHGVPISVTSIAQVKIQGQNKEMLVAACQMFLGKSESEITLETPPPMPPTQEIYKDQQKFWVQVFNVASSHLVNMGTSMVSYTLKAIHNDHCPQDYLHSLGKDRTAQVQCDAHIREAKAKQDAGIHEAQACQEQVSAQLLAETVMAQAQYDFQVQQVLCNATVRSARPRPTCTTDAVVRIKQQIEEQWAQVLVVEQWNAQQVELQEHEIGCRECELEATIHKPAEAERYCLKHLAKAQW